MNRYTIIMLHSFTGKPSEMNYYKPYINRILKGNNIKYIAPRAPLRPITIYDKKKYLSWYDYYTEYCNIEEVISEEQLFHQCDRIHKMIDKEAKIIPMERIYLLGYSQGACMALAAGMTYLYRLGGIIALKGHIPSCIYSHTSKVKQRIFAAHGQRDTTIGFKVAKNSYDKFKYKADIKLLNQPKINHDQNTGIRAQMCFIKDFIK